MLFKLKKKDTVGVSISPEHGLEVIQIDFNAQKIVKYASKPLPYDSMKNTVNDLDIFKDTLQEMLEELQIPKGAEIVVNIPTPLFKITNYPAYLNLAQINSAIEEELAEDDDAENMTVGFAVLPNADIQFKNVAYTVADRSLLIETAMNLKEFGYKFIAADTSVNSTLNALMYLKRTAAKSSSNWVLLQIDNTSFHICSMQGNIYLDCVEEKISIAEVLGDEENYSTVVNAIAPILNNIPSEYLQIVSKTDLISAQKLAGMLTYDTPIIYQEANQFNQEVLIEIEDNALTEDAQHASLEAIGAAIYRDFLPNSAANINLFNVNLGYVYLNEQPLTFMFLGRKVVLSVENAVNIAIGIAILLLIPVLIAYILLSNNIKSTDAEITTLDDEISRISAFLKQNENISSELFNEGDEINMGMLANKRIYNYYTIIGSEIPRKLWLTSLKFDNGIEINGQADNIESIYSFFRNIKDYDPESKIKIQTLGLASKNIFNKLEDGSASDVKSILTSLNADFYQFCISDKKPEAEEKDKGTEEGDSVQNDKGKNDKNKQDKKGSKKQNNSSKNPPDLEPIEEQ